MPSRPTTQDTSSSGRWNSSWARNVPTNFGLESDFHVILGLFYMPQICDMGQMALLSLRRKACWGFYIYIYMYIFYIYIYTYICIYMTTEVVAHYWDQCKLLREWYNLKKERTRTFSVVHNVLYEKIQKENSETLQVLSHVSQHLWRNVSETENQICDVTPSRKSTHLSTYCLCLKYCNRVRVMWWPGTKIQWDPDWWCFGQATNVGLL